MSENYRVGVIRNADDTTVYMFGYGEYIGEQVPTPDVPGFGKVLNELGSRNPAIKLDNGTVVYGLESWWADEDKVNQMIGDREVVFAEVERD